MIVNKVNTSSNYYSNVTTRYTNSVGNVRGVQRYDAFTPSREAQSFSELLNKLKNEPEVREDKVNQLQDEISSGQYFVPADSLALSILTNRF